jgi:hypothetical protein
MRSKRNGGPTIEHGKARSIQIVKEDLVPNSEERPVRKGGPRTPSGKLRASRNSRKLSLFAKEFNLSSEEKAEFDDLRQILRNGLKPGTSLLKVLFENVLTELWRVKLSLRGEQAQLRRYMATQSDHGKDQAVEHEVPMNFPFRVTAGELRRRLKFLDDLQGMIGNGSLDSRLEEDVTKALGEQFWKMLNEFTPVNIFKLQLMSHVVEHSTIHGGQIPVPRPTPKQEAEYREIDAFWRIQMRSKLVEEEKRHLQFALRYLEQTEGGNLGTAASSDRLDLYLRYSSTARREFYRALNAYLAIKEKNI